MKIFAVINPVADREIAYFFYYEKTNEYYMEIADDVDEWDAPFILDSFIRRKQYVLGQEDTRRFISQRIIPNDRQNIGMILKDNGLEEYDEARLFILADGRCAQDECFIRQVTEAKLPDSIKSRRKWRLVAAAAYSDQDYLLGFVNGKTALLHLNLDTGEAGEQLMKRLRPYLLRLLPLQVKTQGTALGIVDGPEITYDRLGPLLTELPFDLSALMELARDNLMTTQDMTENLGCSRQNINDLVKRGRLTPFEMNAKVQLFEKKEYMRMV